MAFYDALSENESAVDVMGDETLSFLARELVQTVRKNVTIDWTIRETTRAKLRVLVRRMLRKYGYPPDLQVKAIQTVLEQAGGVVGGMGGGGVDTFVRRTFPPPLGRPFPSP